MVQVRPVGSAFGYVYLITCLPTGQRYVGQTTVNPFERFASHLSKPSGKMRKVVAAYRAEDLRFEVIDEANDLADLNRKEAYWIDFHNTHRGSLGLNSHAGGERGQAVVVGGIFYPSVPAAAAAAGVHITSILQQLCGAASPLARYATLDEKRLGYALAEAELEAAVAAERNRRPVVDAEGFHFRPSLVHLAEELDIGLGPAMRGVKEGSLPWRFVTDAEYEDLRTAYPGMLTARMLGKGAERAWRYDKNHTLAHHAELHRQVLARLPDLPILNMSAAEEDHLLTRADRPDEAWRLETNYRFMTHPAAPDDGSSLIYVVLLCFQQGHHKFNLDERRRFLDVRRRLDRPFDILGTKVQLVDWDPSHYPFEEKYTDRSNIRGGYGRIWKLNLRPIVPGEDAEELRRDNRKTAVALAGRQDADWERFLTRWV